MSDDAFRRTTEVHGLRQHGVTFEIARDVFKDPLR
jgi:hypothetical protein